MSRGSKPGERRGGRQKGVPNKVTTEAKVIFKQLLDKMAPEVERWLCECADGIEVERTTMVKGADGKEMPVTVLGRQNADPGRAVKLLFDLGEYYFPKLAREEKTIIDASDDELLHEIKRRKDEREKAAQ